MKSIALINQLNPVSISSDELLNRTQKSQTHSMNYLKKKLVKSNKISKILKKFERIRSNAEEC